MFICFFHLPPAPKGGKKSPLGDLGVLTLKIKLYEKEIFIFVSYLSRLVRLRTGADKVESQYRVAALCRQALRLLPNAGREAGYDSKRRSR